MFFCTLPSTEVGIILNIYVPFMQSNTSGIPSSQYHRVRFSEREAGDWFMLLSFFY